MIDICFGRTRMINDRWILRQWTDGDSYDVIDDRWIFRPWMEGDSYDVD